MYMYLHYIYRCLRPTQGNGVPEFCADLGFYDSNDGYFNGSEIRFLQRALSDTFVTFTSNPYNDSECVEPVQLYLCYYYFPLCDISTSEIIPVCDESCDFLFDNDDCLDLMTIAYQEFALYDLPPLPDESCFPTYRNFARPASLSDICAEIEG